MSKAKWIVFWVVSLVVVFYIGFKARTDSGGKSGDGSVAGKAAAGGGTLASLPTSYLRPEQIQGVSFADLGEGKKYTVVKIANEVNCDCGCGKGTLAQCRRDDPGCSHSRTQIEKAIALAKQGQDAEAIKQALNATPKPAAAQPAAPPSDNQVYKVPLDDSPWEGTEYAKVTIVEFSDFQ